MGINISANVHLSFGAYVNKSIHTDIILLHAHNPQVVSIVVLIEYVNKHRLEESCGKCQEELRF